jgi:hypothetical protein
MLQIETPYGREPVPLRRPETSSSSTLFDLIPCVRSAVVVKYVAAQDGDGRIREYLRT